MRILNRYRILLILMFLFHALVSTVGFWNPITDLHGIRQTQTAITAFYFIRNGFQIAYPIPIFGKPWALPLEFPFFQAITAGSSSLLQTPLDQTGRVWSLIFFYLCVWIVLKTLHSLGVRRKARLVVIALFIGNPIYLFWSRTFLMESTALFFSILSFYSMIQIGNKSSLRHLIIGCVAGTLAGLIKITTFTLFGFIGWIVLTGCFLSRLRIQSGSNRVNEVLEYLRSLVYCLGIPVGAALLWLFYSQHVRSLNPLSEFGIVPMTLQDWTFGTISMKLSPATWNGISAYLSLITGHPAVLLIPLLGLIRRTHRKVIVLCFAAFLLGPILFTNLYFFHDYYWYANTIFFCITIGLVWSSFDQRPFRPLTYGILTAILILNLNSYRTVYYPSQTHPDWSWVEIGNRVKQYTHPSDILFYSGYHWDPRLPYYSERKAVIDVWNRPLSDPAIKESIAFTGRESIRGMMVKMYDPALIAERIALFDLNPTPVFKHRWGELYIR